VFAVAIAIFALPVHASQIFVTPAGATTSGGAVSAQATFTAGAGSLTITLQNLLVNPKDVAQLLSDLDFAIPLTASTTLTSSATFINVNADHTTTAGGSGPTGWVFSALTGNHYTLCDICTGAAGPSNLIIGPGPYGNANGSIAGNDPHNPFINQTATFILTNSSITPNSLVGDVVFSFGTTAGIDVPGVPQQNDTPGVPEPTTASLAGLAVLLGIVGRLRQKKSQQ